MPSSFDKFRTKVEDAANGNYYMQVVKKGEMFKIAKVKLSNYINKMSEDNDYIYISSHRLCGNKEQVQSYLKFLGCKEDDIATCIENSYNVSNYEKYTPEIEAEIASIPKNTKKSKTALTYEQLVALGEVFKSSKNNVSEESSEGTPIPGTPSRTKAFHQEDMKTKLYNLPDGVALDITFFKPSTKTGARKVKRTQKGTQRSLGSTLELNRIVFDFEFDSAVAVKFLQEIGKTEEEAIEIVETAKHFKPSPVEVNLLAIAVKK